MTKACTTHHHACACRESHFRRLQQDNSWAEEKLSGMAIELAELRRGVDNLKIRSYELGQHELHDKALALLGGGENG